MAAIGPTFAKESHTRLWFSGGMDTPVGLHVEARGQFRSRHSVSAHGRGNRRRRVVRVRPEAILVQVLMGPMRAPEHSAMATVPPNYLTAGYGSSAGNAAMAVATAASSERMTPAGLVPGASVFMHYGLTAIALGEEQAGPAG
jgi:hypothetical protein